MKKSRNASGFFHIWIMEQIEDPGGIAIKDFL